MNRVERGIDYGGRPLAARETPMNRLRKLMAERPALGWLVAGLLLAVLAWSLFRLRRVDDNPYSLDRTTEMVTIRCRETGEEWQLPRGRMEQMLWDRPAPLDP